MVGFFASIPAASLNGAIAFLAGPLVDQLTQAHNYALLTIIPLGILVVSIVQGVCDYLSDYSMNYVGTAISRDLRLELYEQLSTMDLKYFKESTSGDLLTRYYSDPTILQQAIVTNLQSFLMEFFSALFLASVLLYRSWGLAIIAMVIISFIVIPIQILSKKMRALDHESRELQSTLYDIFNESVFGAKIIMAFGLKAHQQKRFERSLQDFFGNTMRINRAGIVMKPIMQIIASIGIALIVLLGGWQVQHGQMSTGELTSFLIALVLLYRPVKAVGSVFTKIQRILAPAERVFEKLDIKPTLVETPSPQEIADFQSLQFNHVSFAYVPEKPVLQEVSFRVEAGDVIALVGPSGGGKSTLVDLIPRFMDCHDGEILLNNIPLNQISFGSLRRLISIVTQDTVLFEGNIRDNIVLGKLDASEAELEKALDMAYLTDFVAELPKGLETRVGERGLLLSGGQKQRIAIARAFIKQAPLLILDEATSALDNESEAMVQEAMKNLMQGRTVIVIAHRLSTIKHANRILVVQQGRIVESGTHENLLKITDGVYHRLYQLQFRLEQEKDREELAK